ncbi:MAG: DUF4870 domain-containing protein [Phycisphaerales bacterium]|jgi:uncharacterized Tic20 family protein
MAENDPPQESQEPTSPPPQESAPQATDIPKDAKTMAMLCHLLAIFTSFLGPLIIWLIKKDDHPYIKEQGKEALNFQITIVIASIISGLLIMACVGAFLLPAVQVINIVFCIIATVKVNNGEHYRYPIALRLIK